jgi:hypothetical protein
MEADGVNLGVALVQLDSAPDDPPHSTPEYQRELGILLHSLRSNGIGVSARYDALHAVNGGSGFSGTFVTTIRSVGPRFGEVIGAWLNSRYGRKAKLRIGDSEAEAHTAAEFIKLAKDYQKQFRRAN